MAAIVVIGSVVFAVALVLAWLLRPGIRAAMEQPKLRFQDDARSYDRAVSARR